VLSLFRTAPGGCGRSVDPGFESVERPVVVGSLEPREACPFDGEIEVVQEAHGVRLLQERDVVAVVGECNAAVHARTGVAAHGIRTSSSFRPTTTRRSPSSKRMRYSPGAGRTVLGSDRVVASAFFGFAEKSGRLTLKLV